MSTNNQSYLRYAHVQMAAEAFLIDPDTGNVFENGERFRLALQTGNEFNSKFSVSHAVEFDKNWEVVAHQPNTASGFSATLFRGIGDENAGELVIAFRSTEFIGDAMRHNQATNKMEVEAHGWAFGQIADMEGWYASLKATGAIPESTHFAVSVYSLGRHLATAFNLLHQAEGRIAATYTFNGAGVGDVDTGTSLAAVIERFERMRKNTSGAQIVFSHAAHRSESGIAGRLAT